MNSAHHISLAALSGNSTPAWVGLELYLAYAAFAVVALATWWLLSARRRRRRNAELEQAVAKFATSNLGTATESGSFSPRTAVDSGLLQSAAHGSTDASESILFSAESSLPRRRCPRCDRNFPGVFEICPYDTTPLEKSEGLFSATDPDESELPRRFCSACDRRYGPSAQYCYHDGFLLSRDSEEASEDAQIYYICRDCGYETPEETKCCPRDGQPLEKLDPAERGIVVPTIPFNRCRACGYLAAPDQTHCPVDATMMLPEISARITSLPPTGYGHRRRICDQCGSLFGDQCSYCSFDGNDLTPIN